MEASLIPVSASTPELVAQWRDLAGRAAEPNPFHDPDFVLPAVRHLGAGGRVALLIAEAAGRLEFCLPTRLSLHWRNLPIPTLSGWQHDYRAIGSPLVGRGLVAQAAEAVMEYVGRISAPTSMLALDLLSEGPLLAAIENAAAPLRPIRYHQFVRAAVLRRPRASYLTEANRSRRSSQHRARRRALARELGGPVTLVDLSSEPLAVDRFLALEASGWKGRSGSAMACRPGHGAFFREACARLRDRGMLEMLSLEGNGSTLAMTCNLLAGEAVFYFKTAYDERFARRSPGVLLALDALDHFHSGSRRWMDSCSGAGGVLESLWPDRRRLRTVLVPLGRRRRAVVSRAVPLAIATRSLLARHAPRRPDGLAATR